MSTPKTTIPQSQQQQQQHPPKRQLPFSSMRPPFVPPPGDYHRFSDNLRSFPPPAPPPPSDHTEAILVKTPVSFPSFCILIFLILFFPRFFPCFNWVSNCLFLIFLSSNNWFRNYDLASFCLLIYFFLSVLIQHYMLRVLLFLN